MMHYITSLLLIVCTSAYPNRVIGGHDTTIENRPYQASLQMKSDIGVFRHWCGASIISTRFLLTAAHCSPSTNISDFYARVGTNILLSGGQILKVEEFITHPLYVNTHDYDFGIAALASGVEIELGPQVQIVKLANANDDPEVGSMLTLTGWGITSESNDTYPTILQEVDLPVWEHSECLKVYFYITPRQICLGGTPTGGTGACNGDSGGPAVQGNPVVQYGTVSGGSSCSAPNIPGVYGRISPVRAWITEVAGI